MQNIHLMLALSLYNLPYSFQIIYILCGIVGNDRKNVLACVNNIILQLVLFHSYDEVKIIVIYNKNEEAQFHYAKLLPHIWDIGIFPIPKRSFKNSS